MKYAPQRIKVSAEDVEVAKKLANSSTTVVKYLREKPTVEVALLPARDDQYRLIPDAPPIRAKVIARGKPYGCVIAFLDENNEPRIGWSRRAEIEEDEFEKSRAKVTAVLRAKNDSIIEAETLKSEKSGVIPSDVVKMLHHFIPRMKVHFNKRFAKPFANLR